jgi:diguanylate cyclase (GGDEF)-like protein
MKDSQNNDVRLEDILNTTPIAVSWSSLSSGRIEYINKAFSELFGFVLGDILDIESWFLRVSPQPEYYQNVIAPWINEYRGNASAPDLKATLFCKDNSVRHISMCFSTIGDKQFWYFNDITDHWVAEERLRARSDMLEMVAKSSALKDILNVIVKQIQQESPLSLCSVLLFDKDEQCLRLGAAPSFPDVYNQAIDGVKIGLNVGSCGTAAYLGQRVIVEDIYTHPYWEDYTQLARQAEVSACWSDPIMSSKGDLLGTFAIYKRFPSTPSKKDFELINFASHLASIAIESFRAQEALQKRAYFDHLTGLANRGYFFQQCETLLNESIEEDYPLAILMMDVDHFKKVNDEFGHKTGDLVLQKLAKMSLSILRQDDLMARIGGEEFAILLPFTEKDEALLMAERLRESIESSVVLSLDHQKVFFTVSFGVACRQDGNCTVDDILNKADKALYQSKAAGRNCVFSLDGSI